MKSITCFSPAKINLTLDIFPKESEADFHKLETVYHLIDFGDDIQISFSNRFEIEGDFDCKTEDNLIYRAWELMCDFFGEKSLSPVKVLVYKRIPTGGGLGGGSSNVASFVQSYFELAGLGKVPFELIEILGNLGKDIPFFFLEHNCGFGRRFGEVVDPLSFDFSGRQIFLYIPKFKELTANSYKNLETFSTDFTQRLIQTQDFDQCGNGFDELLETKRYKKLLKHQSLQDFHITGSGSVFWSVDRFEIPNCECIETTFF